LHLQNEENKKLRGEPIAVSTIFILYCIYQYGLPVLALAIGVGCLIKQSYNRATPAGSGGGTSRKSSTKKRTHRHTIIAGQRHVIYEGPRGGTYIKKAGKFVAV